MRKRREDKDPDHLFEDADGDAQRKEDCEHGAQGCVVDLRTECPPENPAENAPDEVLDSPGLEEEAQMDVIVPEARIIHSCRAKRQPSETAAPMKMAGCMKSGWFVSCFHCLKVR